MKNSIENFCQKNLSREGVFSIFLLLVILSLILCPYGAFDFSNEVWELDHNRVLKTPDGVKLLTHLGNPVTKKLEVLVQNSGTESFSKKIYRISVDDRKAILNGSVLSLVNEKGETLESSDGEKFYLQKNKVNQLEFSEDFLKNAPKVKALLNPEHKHLKKIVTKSDTRALIYSTNLREIEFYAVLPEDFSADKSEAELVEEVLRITFNANKYLADINLTLIPVGVKIYRKNSKFSDGLKSRDPFEMLAAGVRENSEISVNHDLLAVFSRTYFQRASGLSYVSTACTNPNYSVLFASGGPVSNFYELSISATFAHEVGHFLGMSHDESFYDMGFSLMASHQISMPYGFSSKSKNEQLSHSAFGQEGGQCLTLKIETDDKDGDGLTDIEEARVGTDPLDAGSYHNQNDKNYFLTYNTFNSHGIITELGNASKNTSAIGFSVFDPDGKKIVSNSVVRNGYAEFDLILNGLPGIKRDSYGIVEINSQEPIHARTSTYAFSGNFEKFRYVLQENIFKPVKSKKVFLPFNTIVPGTMPKGSKVVNWLSLINTGNSEEKFRVRTFSPTGILSQERIISIPGKGRRDIPGDTAEISEGMGTHEVEILSSINNVSLNASLNRYYLDQNGRIVSATQIQATPASGVTKNFVYNAGPKSKAFGTIPVDAWIEVVNSELTSNSFRIRAETEGGEVLLNKTFELQPMSQIHLQLPTFTKNYIVRIDPLKVESLSVFGFRYLNDFGVMSVENLKFLEEIKTEKFGSVNTFVNTTNSIVFTNSSKKKGLLDCKVFTDSGTLEKSQELTAESFEIHSIENMFPAVKKDNYSTINCSMKEFTGEVIPNSMRIDRMVEGRLMVEQVMD